MDKGRNYETRFLGLGMLAQGFGEKTSLCELISFKYFYTTLFRLSTGAISYGKNEHEFKIVGILNRTRTEICSGVEILKAQPPIALAHWKPAKYSTKGKIIFL